MNFRVVTQSAILGGVIDSDGDGIDDATEGPTDDELTTKGGIPPVTAPGWTGLDFEPHVQLNLPAAVRSVP